MPDLSVLIPSRNERYLATTIEDVLTHARGDTEVIAVLDGAWADPPIPDDPRIRLTHSKTIIGQRAATNLAAAMSRAKYVMKLDAHCSVDEGFDVKLMKDCQPDWTVIPRMYNLHAFNWRCLECGEETYQGPTPVVVCSDRVRSEGIPLTDAAKAKNCQSRRFEKHLIWQRRKHRRTDFWRFDADLHFQYFDEYRRRPEAQTEIADVMSSVGACFFMERARFNEIGGLDESHGSWGQFGTEIACKSWLSGGRHVVNKQTWFAHLFRTQGGDFSFPYANPQEAVNRAREHSRKLWIDGTWPGAKYPLSWLVEKFWPVPGWTQEQLDALKATRAA